MTSVSDWVVEPCPSTAIAILGVDTPTPVHCGKIAGHQGDHEFKITWTNTSE